MIGRSKITLKDFHGRGRERQAKTDDDLIIGKIQSRGDIRIPIDRQLIDLTELKRNTGEVKIISRSFTL